MYGRGRTRPEIGAPCHPELPGVHLLSLPLPSASCPDAYTQLCMLLWLSPHRVCLSDLVGVDSWLVCCHNQVASDGCLDMGVHIAPAPPTHTLFHALQNRSNCVTLRVSFMFVSSICFHISPYYSIHSIVRFFYLVACCHTAFTHVVSLRTHPHSMVALAAIMSPWPTCWD